LKIKKWIVLIVLIALVCLNFGSAAPVFNQRPIAIIDVTPKEIYACQEIVLDGSRSVDPDGKIISWEWRMQFQDKEIFLGDSPKITLAKPLTSIPGYYKILLTVADNGTPPKSDSRATYIKIKENKVPKIEKIEMSFPDRQVSRWVSQGDEFYFEAILKSETKDDPVNYLWRYDSFLFNFSDPTSAKTKVTVLKGIPGTYKIKVEVTDTCEQKDSAEISIEIIRNSPPKAKISVMTAVNESEYFLIDGSGSTSGQETDEAEDRIERFEWWWTKFNDSEILGWANGEKPWIKISDSGVYDLYLKVADSHGAENTTKKTIIVRETEDDPPIANASRTNRTAILGENFTLDGSASTDDRQIEYYIWKIEYRFAGRYSFEEIWTKKPRINYTFERAGEHKITLTVRDTAFSLQEASATFTVLVERGN
jgi:hypothetical protein